MTDKPGDIAPDLQFLRSIVDSSGGRTQHVTGLAFVAGGGLYAFQCFVNWFCLVFTPNMSSVWWVVLGAGPTVLFLLFCVWLSMKYGMKNTGSATSRAIAAGFQAAGITNVALICIFAPAAMIRQDFTIWLFYPAVVFALQGAVWLMAWQLRRRIWLLAVALGWLVSAVGLGLLIGTAAYLLVCGAALFLFMAVPGVVMMRLAKRQD